MVEFRVNAFLRPFEQIAVEKFSNGSEAIERCRKSLISGCGLCKEELRFLQHIQIAEQIYNPNERFDDFIDKSSGKNTRQSSNEDKDFWHNVRKKYK